MIFKQTFLIGLILALSSLSAFGQVPDPRDSVIIESKFLGSGGLFGAPAVTIKVSITNKDSLTYFTLSLLERATWGGAYMTLSHPRTFSGVVTPLTASLRFYTGANFSMYNSSSADTFLVGAGFDSVNLATVEPPNDLRKPVWELKFDTVLDIWGQIVFDSALIPPDTSVGFVNLAGVKVPVNFIRAAACVCYDCDCWITAVEPDESINFPRKYRLFQNYPNPFNANTQVTFALSKSGRTTLEVFNILGQKVGTLVDEYLSAGTKIVNWDGRDDKGLTVPSGIYFYQLRSGEFRETKKMLVLK